MNNGKHGQGTHSIKMCADKLAENAENAPKFIWPICLPKPKSLGFWWKKASSSVRCPWSLLCGRASKSTLSLDSLHKGNKFVYLACCLIYFFVLYILKAGWIAKVQNYHHFDTNRTFQNSNPVGIHEDFFFNKRGRQLKFSKLFCD